MTESFDTGTNYTTKDGVSFPRSSQYPIIAPKATDLQLDKEQLKSLTQGMSLWK